MEKLQLCLNVIRMHNYIVNYTVIFYLFRSLYLFLFPLAQQKKKKNFRIVDRYDHRLFYVAQIRISPGRSQTRAVNGEELKGRTPKCSSKANTNLAWQLPWGKDRFIYQAMLLFLSLYPLPPGCHDRLL